MEKVELFIMLWYLHVIHTLFIHTINFISLNATIANITLALFQKIF